MSTHLYEFCHLAMEVIKRLYGLCQFATKVVKWLGTLRQENVENEVLNTFGHRNWPWLSARGVIARMKRNAAFDYAPALFPPRVTDFASWIARLRLLPSQLQYFFRRRFTIPSEQKAERILRDLLKRQVLRCASDNPSLYQLAH